MKELDVYITKHYNRWLDYAQFHCSRAGIPHEAVDVLNEVLCSLLQKDVNMLISLINKRSGAYTELDFFVLRMIKLNATSLTSPYRRKYSSTPKDGNIDFSMLEIADVEYDEVDTPAYILRMTNKVRDVVEKLDLSEKHRRIFDFKFFQAESFRDWQGDEGISELYKEYNKVLQLVKTAINGEMLL